MSAFDSSNGRRRFLKLLAASPLLPVAGLHSELREAIASLVGGGPTESESREALSSLSETLDGLDLTGARARSAVARMQNDDLISSVEEAVNVFDFEKLARENTLHQHWAYLATGTDDDRTLRLNEQGFERYELRARRLRDIRGTDTSVELFGTRWDSPIFFCPVASLRGYHTQGEVGVARAARSRGVLQMQSNVSSQSFEDISEALGRPVWFQLYAVPHWPDTERMIRRVEAAGCEHLVWTIDLLGGRNTETNDRALGLDGYNAEGCQMCHEHEPGYTKPMRRGLTGGPTGPGHVWPPTWDYLDRLKDATDMRIILKGIVTREDAEIAVERGADAVMVSNHGGRAEESYRPTIWDLPEVAAGVDGRIPVLFDSGVRRGTSIYKALALGADAVGIGRPYVWGLNGFGQQGVEGVFDILQSELQLVMRQMGTPTIDQITSDQVVDGYRRL